LILTARLKFKEAGPEDCLEDYEVEVIFQRVLQLTDTKVAGRNSMIRSAMAIIAAMSPLAALPISTPTQLSCCETVLNA